VTQPFEWRGIDRGPTSKLQAFPNQEALVDLVNRQPFGTMTENLARPSDVTNIMFLATDDELRAAFDKAGWSARSRLNTKSKLETARALIEARGYKEGPMSLLVLDGSVPDMAYQKGNNTFAKHHHLRIFRRPATFGAVYGHDPFDCARRSSRHSAECDQRNRRCAQDGRKHGRAPLPIAQIQIQLLR